jgi:hypothetical protein
MNKRVWIGLSLIILCLFLLAEPTGSLAQTGQPFISISITTDQLLLHPKLDYTYQQVVLKVSGPGNFAWQQTFNSNQTPAFPLKDGTRVYPDGVYTYELQIAPRLSPQVQATLNAAGDHNPQTVNDLRIAGLLPNGPFSFSGQFQIAQGAFTLDAPVLASNNDYDGNPMLDQVIADDLIVTGSACFGFDCLDGESFGFDTIRLKENNLRLKFDDTSATSGFPANDWQLTANDSISGGSNKFSIEDITGAKIPFTIIAGARTNALFVSETSRVGLGTNTPILNLHIVQGDTPAIRLDQDASSGYTAQTWDIIGNEANFSVRDVTGGSTLPFRIKPGAPTNSLYLGNRTVGLGTSSPDSSLHIVQADPTVKVYSTNNSQNTFYLDSNGNLTLSGLLTEASDVNVKENIRPIDPKTILQRLAGLPISSWNYTADEANVRHIGPMAQDFYAAFAVGADDRHIAALDSNGVALASVQALNQRVEEQNSQLAALQAQNRALEARLARLENQPNQAPAVLSPWLFVALGALLPLWIGLGAVAVFFVARRQRRI